jgi:hypothetical protein
MWRAQVERFHSFPIDRFFPEAIVTLPCLLRFLLADFFQAIDVDPTLLQDFASLVFILLRTLLKFFLMLQTAT